MIELWIGSAMISCALLVALVNYKKLNPPWLRLFVIYLLLTLLVQPFGYYYSKLTHKSNHFIFNLHQIFQYGFYFFLFVRSVQTKPFRMVVLVAITVFVSFALSNIFFGQGFFQFNGYTYSIGAVLIIICCVLYFWELFKSERTVHFFRLPMFWIATGLLFYFAGTEVYLGMLDYINARGLDPGGNLYAIIMVTLNFILYSLIAIGLFPRKNQI